DDSQWIRCWIRARQERIRSCAARSHAHGHAIRTSLFSACPRFRGAPGATCTGLGSVGRSPEGFLPRKGDPALWGYKGRGGTHVTPTLHARCTGHVVPVACGFLVC